MVTLSTSNDAPSCNRGDLPRQGPTCRMWPHLAIWPRAQEQPAEACRHQQSSVRSGGIGGVTVERSSTSRAHMAGNARDCGAGRRTCRALGFCLAEPCGRGAGRRPSRSSRIEIRLVEIPTLTRSVTDVFGTTIRNGRVLLRSLDEIRCSSTAGIHRSHRVPITSP